MIYIGDASKLSGASIKAIRYYEKLGLLPNVVRSGSYRTYSQGDIDTIKLIKEAQKIGFKLSELKTVLEMDKGSWVQIEQLVRRKYAQLGEQIKDLNRQRAQLDNYANSISSCLAENPNCDTPLIDQVS